MLKITTDKKIKEEIWCDENCGQVDPIECWKHALKEGWLD